MNIICKRLITAWCDAFFLRVRACAFSSIIGNDRAVLYDNDQGKHHHQFFEIKMFHLSIPPFINL